MRQHYYSLAFFDVMNGQATYGNAYAWLPEQQVTRQVIAQAKRNAGVSHTATLLNCSYLGYMTQQEFDR